MNSFIFRLFLVATCLLTLTAAAGEYRPDMFSPTQDGRIIQKLQIEEWMKSRTASALAIFLPQNKFFVSVNLSFKPESHKTETIDLGAIDFGIQVQKKDAFGESSNSGLDQISSVEITVALDRGVPQENLSGITALAKSVIPFISASKIKVSLIQLTAPALSFEQRIKEVQSTALVVLVVMILGVLILGLFLIRAGKFIAQPNYYFNGAAPAHDFEHAAQDTARETPRYSASSQASQAQPSHDEAAEGHESEQSHQNVVELERESPQEQTAVKVYVVSREFPENQILAVPENLAELAFLTLAPVHKVGLLAVMSPRARSRFLEMTTDQGSKLRSFLDVEVENCVTDRERLRHHQQEKNDLARLFANECAEVLRARKDLKANLSKETEAWINGEHTGRQEESA